MNFLGLSTDSVTLVCKVFATLILQEYDFPPMCNHVQLLLLEKIFKVLCVSFQLCPNSFQAESKFKSQISNMYFGTLDSDFLSLDSNT